jgi:hypothetical protein
MLPPPKQRARAALIGSIGVHARPLYTDSSITAHFNRPIDIRALPKRLVVKCGPFVQPGRVPFMSNEVFRCGKPP